ncbi:MAG TPA: hypothetical protein VNH11_20545 [Pirellulales bacterium]|nr:hypothetical protein [Pirellulales bacterium]
MNTYKDSEIHCDHCQWTSERALWHDDVRVWEQEIDEMGAKLRRVEAVLIQHRHDLQVHAAALRLYDDRDARREHALAQYEKEGNDEKGMVLEHAHESEVSQQARQRERHHELKAAQRRLMANLLAMAKIADHLQDWDW